ncbi:MAG: glycosyltransferase, partial [Candidatus Omnitrophica bacterium]|nr:glycosyltransferase [Candidatus Omnitrophota bacterium]
MITDFPMMSLIIPCYNEQDNILEKLKDTRNLEYPKEQLEIIFADGGSEDNTLSLLKKSINEDENIRVINCPKKGKINQVNHVLPGLKGEIIVNSDTDSRLDKLALKWLATEFSVADDIYVVGAYCYPADTIKVEKYYWSAQNRFRLIETDARSSSIVIAQCYAFRKTLLKAFPDDVIADDIYIAFLANSFKKRTIYSRYAKAIETRVPKNYSEFIPHKFRKSNAFLRESLRFLYKLPEMGNFCKVMLLTRISQQLLLPCTLLFWFLLAGTLMTLFRFDLVFFSIIFLSVLLILTSKIFSTVILPEENYKPSIKTIIEGYAITNLILIATGVSYLFYRQESSYRRF